MTHVFYRTDQQARGLTAAFQVIGSVLVLFTAGYTDNMPQSLLRPVASLPLAVFFQLNTPFPEVQERAYASALVLMMLVLIISLLSRPSLKLLGKYVVR